MIQANSYQEFKLIYHPEIFQNNVFEGNKNRDIISIKTVWQCKGKRYFKIEILDGQSNYEYRYSYILDEDYNWVKYDGCDEEGIECLKDENIIERDR